MQYYRATRDSQKPCHHTTELPVYATRAPVRPFTFMTFLVSKANQFHLFPILRLGLPHLSTHTPAVTRELQPETQGKKGGCGEERDFGTRQSFEEKLGSWFTHSIFVLQFAWRLADSHHIPVNAALGFMIGCHTRSQIFKPEHVYLETKT